MQQVVPFSLFKIKSRCISTKFNHVALTESRNVRNKIPVAFRLSHLRIRKQLDFWSLLTWLKMLNPNYFCGIFLANELRRLSCRILRLICHEFIVLQLHWYFWTLRQGFGFSYSNTSVEIDRPGDNSTGKHQETNFFHNTLMNYIYILRFLIFLYL